MAQLTALIVTLDDGFRQQAARMLRGCGVPFSVVNQPSSSDSHVLDLVVVDIRADIASGMAAIERLRAGNAALAIFAIASSAEPDLILQAMRAGANEFFPWLPGDATPQTLSMSESLQSAVRRTAARREAVTAGMRAPSSTLVFLGAKGGAGTTTVAVNSAVELVRQTKKPTIIVDLKAYLGEVALFLGVRPRFTLLDAIENLHRLDKEFMRELVSRHKSGLDILAGSEQFDRPGAQDATAVEELFRILGKLYDYVVIDAGNLINACAVAALYAADSVFLVANPDVPSIRNAQRLVDRVRQFGAGSERIKVVMNRSGEQQLIAPKEIETALGYGIHHSFSNDYRTVSTALNSGVPLTLTNHSEISAQFGAFTKLLLGIEEPTVERRRAFLGLF